MQVWLAADGAEGTCQRRRCLGCRFFQGFGLLGKMLPLARWSVTGNCLDAFPPLKANIQGSLFNHYRLQGALHWETGCFLKEKEYPSSGLLHYYHGLPHYGDVYCFPLSQVFKCPLLTRQSLMRWIFIRSSYHCSTNTKQVCKRYCDKSLKFLAGALNISNKRYDTWQNGQEIIRLKKTVWAISLQNILSALQLIPLVPSQGEIELFLATHCQANAREGSGRRKSGAGKEQAQR